MNEKGDGGKDNDGNSEKKSKEHGEDLPPPSSDSDTDEDEAAIRAALTEMVKIPDITDHRIMHRRYKNYPEDSDDEEEEIQMKIRPEHLIDMLVRQRESHQLKSVVSSLHVNQVDMPMEIRKLEESEIKKNISRNLQSKTKIKEDISHISIQVPTFSQEDLTITPSSAKDMTPEMQLKYQRIEAASTPKYYRTSFPPPAQPSPATDNTKVVGTQTPPLYSQLEPNERSEKLSMPILPTTRHQTGIINILTGAFRHPLSYESDSGISPNKTAEAGTITNPADMNTIPKTDDQIDEVITSRIVEIPSNAEAGTITNPSYLTKIAKRQDPMETVITSLIVEPKPLPPPPANATSSPSDFHLMIEERKDHFKIENEKQSDPEQLDKLRESESMRTLTIVGHSHITTRWMDHCHYERQSMGIDKVARRKLILASVLCVAFMVAEIIGGILSNSLAIATDAAHLLTDLAGFLISLFALYISARPSTQRMNFGWHRAEVIGAMISVYFIWVITGVLVWLAFQRLLTGQHDVNATVMLITSGLAILVNIIMAVQLTHGHSHSRVEASRHTRLKTKESRISAVSLSARTRELEKSIGHGHDPAILMPTSVSHQYIHEGINENINVRAAVIHVIGDMIQSVGVFLAAIIIFFVPEWAMVDSICTFLFSIIVLIVTFRILRDVMMVLMEATPDYMDYEEVQQTFLSIDGVVHVHNLRIWAISINKVALSAHLAIDSNADPQVILEKATTLIHKRYRFFETTIQIEEYTPGMEDCEQCTTPVVRRSKDISNMGSSMALDAIGNSGVGDTKNEIVTQSKWKQ